MNYRRASILDISSIIWLLSKMHEEGGADLARANWTKVGYAILQSISSGVVWLAENDSEIVGSIGGYATSDWYSDDKYLGDLWCYVEPESRKSNAAKELISRFRDDAKEANLPVKLGPVFNGHDTDRKENFYSSLGLKRLGAIYSEEKVDG
jgi:GNAT superfamily N-acetyltransferase